MTDAELHLLESAQEIIFLDDHGRVFRPCPRRRVAHRRSAMVTFLMTIIAAGVGAYLCTYLREKGKNLANKVSRTATIGRLRPPTGQDDRLGRAHHAKDIKRPILALRFRGASTAAVRPKEAITRSISAGRCSAHQILSVRGNVQTFVFPR
ncbi:hypothetical protein AB4Y32_04885 [Paraburkholderia phymatum]|uniref:Uncharacterized protein n=1 Tax=Paraburkholderia phymatum TaxID=148447 RepID=A0ACC6TUX9_9BURK